MGSWSHTHQQWEWVEDGNVVMNSRTGAGYEVKHITRNRMEMVDTEKKPNTQLPADIESYQGKHTCTYINSTEREVNITGPAQMRHHGIQTRA